MLGEYEATNRCKRLFCHPVAAQLCNDWRNCTAPNVMIVIGVRLNQYLLLFDQHTLLAPLAMVKLTIMWSAFCFVTLIVNASMPAPVSVLVIHINLLL